MTQDIRERVLAMIDEISNSFAGQRHVDSPRRDNFDAYQAMFNICCVGCSVMERAHFVLAGSDIAEKHIEGWHVEKKTYSTIAN